ncbi:hypothetical protein SDC9_191407 [bioreactor metagenome]|uniref:Uncharacterized protein n=1 Tax=bioreactor metagenome TaxID=1076179 RepID=A0A645HZ32_9ZZZZ
MLDQRTVQIHAVSVIVFCAEILEDRFGGEGEGEDGIWQDGVCQDLAEFVRKHNERDKNQQEHGDLQV